jgi:hypothetical protein
VEILAAPLYKGERQILSNRVYDAACGFTDRQSIVLHYPVMRVNGLTAR